MLTVSKLCSSGRKKGLPSPSSSLFHFLGFSRTAQSLLPSTGALSGTPTHEKDTEEPISRSYYHNRHTGRLSVLAGSIGCSSSTLWTHEVEEDFETDPCKNARSFSNYAVCDGYAQKVSVRIEAPMAGILDKELLRKRRTQPFTEMQSLGVGLYRDKQRNRRSFSTAAMESSNQDESLGGCCAKVPNAGTTCEGMVCGAEVDDDVGVMDSDSEEEDYGDVSKPSISSIIQEESMEALEVSLKEMENAFEPTDVRIGTTCLRLAQLYDAQDEEPETILSHAEKALKILEPLEDMAFDVAMCYHVIGSACYKMDESEKAISNLEKAAELFEKVGEAEASKKSVGTIKYAGQILLGHSRMSIGKQEEGLKNYEKALAINEAILEPGNPDLARSYQQAAEAFVEAEKYEVGLTLCLKALPIYENFYGSASFEVAVLRRLMALIHDEQEEYEKVLIQHEIIRPILAKLKKMKEVASLDLSSGEALVALKRFKDAISKFKEVVNETKESSRFHGHALVLLGKVYAEMGEGKNAVKYCKKAFNALKGKKLSLEAGSSLIQLGSVYHQLNELDQALAVLKKAYAIFEEYPDQVENLAEIEGQIGLVYIFMGKVEQALPYLERAGSKSEEIYGKDSEELLAVYNHTAIAYLELERFEDALVKFEAAKRIAVENMGPEDGDTLAIYSNLVNTYSGLERHDKAIECQKYVVDALKRGNTDYDIPIDEAEKRLKELMEQAKSVESGKSS